MKLARALSEAEAKKIQSFILYGGIFTTLAIWTKLEDPINLPKMFVLVLFGAIVLGLSIPALLGARKHLFGSQIISLGLIGLFIVGLLVSTITTDVKYTAFFGEYHRNNGALAYLATAILMAGSIFAFNIENSSKYLKFFSVTGLILTGYGFLQGAGKDPIGWKLDYNPFITTLGNPNFTSGFLGLAGVAILLLALESKDRLWQVALGIGLLADLYILKRSGSVQGLFGFLIGAAIILIVKIWLVNKKYGQISLILAALGSTPAILAILNIGPLASKLYQGTLRNRLDYWNAAINMFKDHPILGVGVDRFGENYRQYAVQNQVAQGQLTDNAHSVYLQLLSTGGLILFIPFVFLIGYISYLGFTALIKFNGKDKLRVGGIFGIWVGSLAVNIVTIDNLGVSVWFWITGGVLIAVSNQLINKDSLKINLPQITEKQKKKNWQNTSKQNQTRSNLKFPFPAILAGGLALVVLILGLPIMSESQTIKEMRANNKQLTAASYVAELNKMFVANKGNPQNLILIADLALNQGEIDLSYKITNQVRKLDARSFYGNYLPAVAYEATGKTSEAIQYRTRLLELDPWNTSNMLQLIKNYLSVGKKEEASQIAQKIRQNYPGSAADSEATALLVG